MISANEINFLIHRHLQETGFPHTAYVFSNEACIEQANFPVDQLPPHAFVTILKNGMLYLQLEKAINEKAKEGCSSDDIVLSLINAVKNEEPIIPHKNQQKQKIPNPIIPKPLPFIVNPTIIDDEDVLFLRGHFDEVYCGAWSNDGKLFASGSKDATAIIWEINNHEYVTHYTLDHATQENRKNLDITALSWNPSGTILATGCMDGIARLWSSKGELKFVLNCHSDSIYALQFSPDGASLLTCGGDNRIIYWDVATGEMKQIYSYHSNRIMDVDWYDNKTFASCASDSLIAISNIDETQPRYILRGHTSEVNKIEWDPTKKMLASCSDDHTIRIWKPFENPYAIVLTGHTEDVYTIKWAPGDSHIIASGSFDFTVRLWNVATESCIAVFDTFVKPVYSVWFSPLGKFLVAGGVDGNAMIWRVSDFAHIATYSAESCIYEAKWDNTGENIALCLSNSMISIISTEKLPYYQE